LWTSEDKNYKPKLNNNNAPKENKEGTGSPSEGGSTEKLAAQRSKAMEPKVSLQGDGDDDSTCRLEEVDACRQTTGDEEGLIQSNKDSKRK
jgi:hypothetical protein